ALPNVSHLTRPGASGEIQNLGMTDAIRELFRTILNVMEPTTIRDTMQLSGFDFGDRQNAMANIHQVLRRLVAAGEIEHVQVKGGKPGFRLAPKPTSKDRGGIHKWAV